jgi:23S rRNA (pseudouridine1915-N3)-methyltransferase
MLRNNAHLPYRSRMRIQILAIGKMKSGPERVMLDGLLQRSRHLALPLGWSSVEELELSPRKDGREAEAAAFEASIPRGFMRIILDERGKPEPSVRLAERLQTWRDEARAGAAFVVGGADGHGEAFRATADHLLAFGPQTWPHRLARVMIAEQIYRAATILTGHPYHRE